MKPAGWLSAAIEILEAIETRHLPVKHALSDWGRSHRFAGSKDRSAIGNLIYDVMRHRAALAFVMGDDSARALALAGYVHCWGEEPQGLNASFDGDKFAPELLSEAELKLLSVDFDEKLKEAPLWVQANIPEWLFEPFTAEFGESLVAEGLAMAIRAPIDLRVNTLKASMEKLEKAMSRYQPERSEISSVGLRVKSSVGSKKSPNLEAEAAHGKGWFEVQDFGSQMACLMTGAKAGDQILDLCAGAGGKTLALSALTENKGQIHAYDNDKQRLRPIFERLKRAGCRNVQTHEAGDELSLTQLERGMDIVLVDAPCTGTGTWRRHPDAKWRLSEKSLNERVAEQKQALETAVKYVKLGGRLVYVTCSLLPVENSEQIAGFLKAHTDFTAVPYGEVWEKVGNGEPLQSANGDETNLTLTPGQHGTDGFFISILQQGSTAE